MQNNSKNKTHESNRTSILVDRANIHDPNNKFRSAQNGKDFLNLVAAEKKNDKLYESHGDQNSLKEKEKIFYDLLAERENEAEEQFNDFDASLLDDSEKMPPQEYSNRFEGIKKAYDYTLSDIHNTYEAVIEYLLSGHQTQSDASVFSVAEYLLKKMSANGYTDFDVKLLQRYFKSAYNYSPHSYFESLDNKPKDNAPYLLNDKNLASRKRAAPEFEKILNRDAVVEAVRLVLNESGLSQRKFAEKHEIGLGILTKILSGRATIDQSNKLLQKAGYGLQTKLVPIPKPTAEM